MRIKTPAPAHPYVEVAFTIQGCVTITVVDERREVEAGGIVVIPAGTLHQSTPATRSAVFCRSAFPDSTL